MPEEEKKKKRKLVVEETSMPEEPADQPDSETVGSQEKETVEEKVEPGEVSEPEPQEEKIEVEIKKERPKGSILIPKNEERPELTPEETQEKDSKVSGFWVFALAIFIIASLIGGGTLIFKAGVEKGKLESQGTPELLSSPTPEPTASPSAEIKREDLKLQVLNGTGQAGVAAAAQEYLEGLGYQDVAVGNAPTSDFTETEISIKDDKKDYLETLRSDLAKEYEVASAAEALPSSSDFDAVITIGTSTN